VAHDFDAARVTTKPKSEIAVSAMAALCTIEAFAYN
jgi:hypothetical protein